jgi:MYXO-CTERM domain-containing protein
MLYRTIQKVPNMKNMILAVSAVSAVTSSVNAGFLGFVASARNVGGNTIVDVFAGVSDASDKFLGVYNTVSDTVFVQKNDLGTGLGTKTWKPDTAGFTSTRNTLNDSFMTAGTFTGGQYGGEYYASTNTNPDANFTGTSWNATTPSAAATTIPNLAGWYTGSPSSVDNVSESLLGMVGRVNGTGAADATRGIWCAHLVIAGNNAAWNFSASASIKDGLTGVEASGTSTFAVPAPGAVALLGLAGFAARRRRA